MKTGRGVARLGLLIVAVLAGAGAEALMAQDAHYWTENYGTESPLLGGAVIGSVQDLSSVYYNPGGFALLTNPSVLLNIEALQYEWIRAAPSSPDAPVLESGTFETSPGIAAVSLPGNWTLGQRVALSYLARRRFSTLLEGSSIDPRAVDELPAGEVGRSRTRGLNQEFTEHWVGATWARALREGLGVGVTTNVAIRSQRFRYTTDDQRLNADSAAATSALEVGFDYWHVRLLWKAGLQYERPGWSAGATVTTPSVGIYGKGSVGATRTVAGDLEELFPEGTRTIGAVDGDDLRSSVKSSWALGAGGHVAVGERTNLHAAAEWFAAVDGDEVVGIDGFRIQLPGDSAGLHVIHGLESVINVGGGVKHLLEGGRAIYLALTTDFSAALPPSGDFIRTEFTRWDLYHLTVGAAFRIRDSDITLGMRYSRGSGAVSGDLIQPPEGFGRVSFTESGAGMEATYNRIKFMLGLNINLLAGGG